METNTTDTDVIVTLQIPALFCAKVVVSPDGTAKIDRFVVTPLESYAGYLGDSADVYDMRSRDGSPLPEEIVDVASAAAVAAWERGNVDGDWPLKAIAWEE